MNQQKITLRQFLQFQDDFDKRKLIFMKLPVAHLRFGQAFVNNFHIDILNEELREELFYTNDSVHAKEIIMLNLISDYARI